MIDKTTELTTDVNELHTAIDALPNVKNIEINVTGDALATINTIRTDLDTLDDRTIEVNVVYKNIGGPENIQEATQVVNQVVVPANDNIQEQTQLVKQVTEDTGNLGENADELDASKQAAAELAAENDSLAAAIEDVRQKMADENLSAEETAGILSKLAYASQVVASATRDASDATHDNNNTNYDSLGVLNTITDSVLTLARTDKIASDAQSILADDTEATARTFGDAIPLWQDGAGWLGVLTGHVQLFGGALTATGIPAIIATASGLHILLDSVVEIGSTLIPAGIAFGAFAIGAAGVVSDLYSHMVDLFTVTQALQQNIYPFSGALSALQAAVKPEVYVLFGEALQVIGTNTGAFTKLASAAGGVLDTLGARLEIALTSGNGFNQFLKNATSDLAGWGNLIGNIFGILGNVLKTLPGYGQFFLQLADNFTAFVEAVTSSPIVQDFIGFGLAAHGFVLWAGLGVTAAVVLANAITGLGVQLGITSAEFEVFNAAQFGLALRGMWESVVALGTALFTMAGAEDVAAASTGILDAAIAALDAVNPIAWIGLAVGALVGLVVWLNHSSSASDQFTQSLSAAIQNAPTLAASITIATSGLQQLKANYESTGAQIDDINEKIKEQSAAMGVQGQLYEKGEGELGGYSAALATLNSNLANAKNEHAADAAEISQVNTYIGNYSALVKVAGGNTAALTAVGITQNDLWNASKTQLAQYAIEIKGYNDALQAASDGTGRFAAAENALSFANEDANNKLGQIDQSMQKVTQAQSQLTGVLTGGVSAWVSYEQGMGTLSNDAKATGASYMGLSANALTLTGQFQQQLTSMQGVINAEELQGVSTKTLTAEVATMAGSMETFAGSNVTAKTQIVDLINDALGPGTVNLKSLDSWTKQNSTSQQGLAADIAITTQKASALAQTLGGDVNAMMAQSIADAYGGQKAFDAFAQGVLSGNTQSTQFVSAGKDVLKTLESQTGSAPAAQQAFMQYAENGLGLSKQAAHNLYDEITGNLTPAIDSNSSTITASGGIMDAWKDNHINPAKTAIDIIKGHTDDFGTSLDPGLTGSMDTAGNHSDNLHNQHLSPLQQIVKDLNTFVGNFETAMSHWPSSESTNVKVSGSGSTKISSTIPGVSGGSINLSNFGVGLAGGGVIPGYAPGHDSIPAMLSPGEGVLVPQAVRAMGGSAGIKALNEQYQHFANGGIVLPNVTQWAQNTLGQSTTAITNAYKTVITNAINNMKNQAAELALASGPAGGATGSEMANGAELYQYLLKNVFDGHKIAAAGAIASIWGESTWNPFSINCVPLTYKVVTTRGILAHDEVRVGDETPVLNPKTGEVELATVLDIPYHPDARICRLGNMDWSVICTWDHKWITADGLVRADEMHAGMKIRLGDDRWEVVEFALDMGFEDTFCLTTSTGTWTAYRDETVVEDEGCEVGAFWTGNSDGRGLIGWTPQGTISNAAFEGGMATQEPAIIQFINSSGDEGVIREMMSATSVAQAANEWGVGVERYGIDDVHAEGIALATSIMNAGGSTAPAQGLAVAINHAARSTQDSGGWIYPGLNMIQNNTGRIERTLGPNESGGEYHFHTHLNGKEIAHEIFPDIQAEGFRYASRNNGNGSNKANWAPGNKR